MLEVGRLAIKTAGRDAGKHCVVVEVIDKTFVLIDGQVRRKKCNVKHVEPLKTVIKIKKGASHAEVLKEFKKLKLDVVEKKTRKKTGARPKRKRVKKEKPVKKAKKEVKKDIKKEKKPDEKKEVKKETKKAVKKT